MRPVYDQEQKLSVRISGAGGEADIVRDALADRLVPEPEMQEFVAFVAIRPKQKFRACAVYALS